MLPEQSTQATVSSVSGPSTARPIAGTMHRRTDSLRSLRSQTSDTSSASALPTPSFPPPLGFPPLVPQPRFNLQQPPLPSAGLSPIDVPTAYLDLDFAFLRANQAFLQVVSSGQDVLGRNLSSAVAPADTESFPSIRNRLRGEREAREPAYMPPILQAGGDPLQGVSEMDVDRLTQSFADHTYTWTRSQPNSARDTFPARVRLAKAAVYFVVVTLPTFRPVPLYQSPVPAAPFAAPPSFPMTEGYIPQREGATQSAPPTFYQPYPSAGGLPPLERPLEQSRTYPSYPLQQAYPPYQQPRPPTTPRLPVAEPPTETTPFTPPAVPREVMRPPGLPMQLPPLIATSAGPSGPSGLRPTEAQAQQVSSSEEEGDDGQRLRSPKKRRRVGIDDVLQR